MTAIQYGLWLGDDSNFKACRDMVFPAEKFYLPYGKRHTWVPMGGDPGTLSPYVPSTDYYWDTYNPINTKGNIVIESNGVNKYWLTGSSSSLTNFVANDGIYVYANGNLLYEYFYQHPSLQCRPMNITSILLEGNNTVNIQFYSGPYGLYGCSGGGDGHSEIYLYCVPIPIVKEFTSGTFASKSLPSFIFNPYSNDYTTWYPISAGEVTIIVTGWEYTYNCPAWTFARLRHGGEFYTPAHNSLLIDYLVSSTIDGDNSTATFTFTIPSQTSGMGIGFDNYYTASYSATRWELYY